MLDRLFPDPAVGKANEENRRAWLERTLAKIPAGARILDAGAGELANRPFCSHLKYVSQDFCEYHGEGDGVGLQMGQWDVGEIDIRSDITTIPEKDGSFDVVLCSEVLEHIPDPQAALSEFYRLLRSDGWLIVTAPFGSLTHFAPYHYASGFNRYFYKHHLEALGFGNIAIEPNGNYFEHIAQEVRRIEAVGGKYTEVPFGRADRWATRLILRWLDRLNRQDKGSAELSCFGYHVVARKR